MWRFAFALPVLGTVVFAFAPGASAPAASRHKAAHAAPVTSRYSLVHGCYDVRQASGQAISSSDEPLRMQAAALGEYLLYGVHSDYVGQGLTPVSSPGPSTVWAVTGNSHSGFRMQNLAGGGSIPVTFTPASGCAVYPEGQVDASGTPFAGSSPEATVNGTIDAHTHVTAFEFLGGDFHCGRPWDPYGVAFALPNCAKDEQGSNGQVGSFLDYGQPSHPHDTVGWPTFHAWPSPTDLAEEGDYYTGIERAWKAGLRMMVTQLVDNEALCMLMTTRHNPCNDMQSVLIQARDLRALQDYVDAQSGGPGKGFFQIVTNPFQARQVVNQGKLAVVEGIEVSDLFNCGEFMGTPKCNANQVDNGLKEVRQLGVSTFFPIHKFDNAFGGTKMDSGETGVLVNNGNKAETGQYWNVQTCTGPEHDSTQLTPTQAAGLPALTALMKTARRRLPLARPAPHALPVGLPTLPGLPTGSGGLTSQVPVYPPPPHCNVRGLTGLGAYLINQMIKQHFIVELDHMDAKTADAALSIIEAHRYSGVISAHSWDSPQENAGIYKVGGFVTPIAGASPASFVSQWQASLKIRNKRFYDGTGFGYGADMNGLAEESQPDTSNPISYPFKSFDGKVTFTREQWGQRTFDLNKDGVANYGMFADWLQELQKIGGRPLMTDMFHGAEAYLEMWERAYGVPATSCRPAAGRMGRNGLGALKLGDSAQSLLFAAGQPSSRSGRSYRYCVSGAPRAGMAAVFNSSGRVSMVLSTASRTRGGRLHPGSRSGRIARIARSLGSGLWLGRRAAAGARFVYRVRRGHVVYVAVVSRADARHARTIRSDLLAAGVR
jgi:hypothetical protein